MKRQDKRTARGDKAAESETDLSQVRVQLKPLFGIRPGTYLTVVYAIILAAGLFFLLVYPGLRSRGTYVTFASRPDGAAVLVDGVYRGATPAEILVPAGLRRVEVSRPSFKPALVERSFAGPVFATLFVKPRARIHVDLEVANLQALLDARLRDYTDYAYKPGASTLTETARFLASPPVRALPGVQERLEAFLAAAMPHLSAQAGNLADFLRAEATVASGGGVLSAGGLERLVRSLAALAQQRDYWLYWVMLDLPGETGKYVTQQAWFAAAHKRLLAALPAPAPQPRPTGRAAVSVAGVTLRPIPAGVAVIGDDTRLAARAQTIALETQHAVTISAFLMGETEVTNRQFAAFLADEPSWSPSNMADLMKQGLVEDRYLEGWDGTKPPPAQETHPVAGVSYHAARAYCRWLTARLPPELQGYVVRLPCEAEWEWAARGGGSGAAYPGGAAAGDAPFLGATTDGTVPAGSTSANGYGLREIMGNVWEWCEDWYAPGAYLMRSSDPGENRPDTSALIPGGSEKVVRGGSWANEARAVAVYTRGSQPPSWTTPYLGFRVVASPAQQ